MTSGVQAPVAQRIERRPPKAETAGPNPAGGTGRAAPAMHTSPFHKARGSPFSAPFRESPGGALPCLVGTHGSRHEQYTEVRLLP